MSLLVSVLSEKFTVHLLEAEHFHWLVGVRNRVDVPGSFISILPSFQYDRLATTKGPSKGNLINAW